MKYSAFHTKHAYRLSCENSIQCFHGNDLRWLKDIGIGTALWASIPAFITIPKIDSNYESSNSYYHYNFSIKYSESFNNSTSYIKQFKRLKHPSISIQFERKCLIGIDFFIPIYFRFSIFNVYIYKIHMHYNCSSSILSVPAKPFVQIYSIYLHTTKFWHRKIDEMVKHICCSLYQS